MGTRGYSSYHGRRSGSKVVMVVILLAVFLLAAGYLVLQNFVVYESDGSIRLDLPFFEKDDTPAGDELPEIPPVEILPGDEGGEEEAPPQITAEAIRAQRIAAAQFCRAPEELLGAAAENDCSSIVVPVKGDNGIFFYTSPLAKTKATDAQAVSQTLLQTTLEQTQLRKIAQLSCFHDSFFAFSDMAGAGICQSSGYIWYDNHSSYWLDASKSAAREYLCAVAKECAAMGFDELLLTEFGYPTEGRLSQIDYSGMTMTKEAALELFLTELRAAVGDEIAISVVLSEEAILAGGDETAGIALSAILPLVDRIYVSAADRSGVLAALESAGAADAAAITVWMEGDVFTSAFLERE